MISNWSFRGFILLWILNNIKLRKKILFISLLLIVCLAIHFFSIDAERVENTYSLTLYPHLAAWFRLIFGWIPFSIGDILWLLLVLFFLKQFFHLLQFLFFKEKREVSKHRAYKFGYPFLLFVTIFYILFNIFWGINYNRQGIASQLRMPLKEYSLVELKIMNSLLVKKINSTKQSLLRNKTLSPTTPQLFVMTENAYKNIAKQFPFLQYHRMSLKQSMWGWVGNYTGFVGYYNPATGEAQVNTTVPKFTQPFTACHEVAHQLGYAKEMEANFVGYLVAASSKDTIFQYSVYTDLFTYANRTLYFADSSSAFSYRRLLLSSVLDDFKERRKFSMDHTSFLEPIFRFAYGLFLKSNEQPEGILSYDEVTGFIIAYYNKFGTI